ncbi:MAG: tRNA lysidine(34) synthetase TilS [Rhizobiaceae bacterium]|nr:tRNA lysidine(34) synthetase TilS [Rhizobiaceae bacterium]
MNERSSIDLQRVFSTFDFASRRAVVAAVSGGSDSLAMLLLLKRWLEQTSPSTHLVAVTVDHALRSASAHEAQLVHRFCTERGVAHRIVNWTGSKPQTGISSAARLARYRLLAEVAHSERTDIVVTGHTSDDQAETVAMRLARGKGRGLAGMATATLFDNRVWIARPLLDEDRQKLRAFLRRRGVSWVDDPTNEDAKYERARMRETLAAGTEREASRRDLLAIAENSASERIALAEKAAGLIRSHASSVVPGLVRLHPAVLREEIEPLVLVLRVLLAVCGGKDQLPDRPAVGLLANQLREGGQRATLSRTVIDPRRAGIFLYREKRNLPDVAPAHNGAVWDGRYRLSGLGNSVTVEAATRHHEFGCPQAVPASICRAAAQSRPLFRDANGTYEVRSDATVVPVLAPWRCFLPAFDLVLARTVSELLSADEIPAPPFVGHNGQEG